MEWVPSKWSWIFKDTRNVLIIRLGSRSEAYLKVVRASSPVLESESYILYESDILMMYYKAESSSKILTYDSSSLGHCGKRKLSAVKAKGDENSELTPKVSSRLPRATHSDRCEEDPTAIRSAPCEGPQTKASVALPLPCFKA